MLILEEKHLELFQYRVGLLLGVLAYPFFWLVFGKFFKGKSMLASQYSLAPYKPGTKIFEFVTTGNTNGKFVRVFKNEGNMSGRWIVDKKSIEGLTPIQIKDKLALPYIPQYVADVDVSSGITLRKGALNPSVFDSSGKYVAYQYEIAVEKLPVGFNLNILFKDPRSLP